MCFTGRAMNLPSYPVATAPGTDLTTVVSRYALAIAKRFLTDCFFMLDTQITVITSIAASIRSVPGAVATGLQFYFNRVRSLEGFLNAGGSRFEPIVFPLAIYKELILPETSNETPRTPMD